jgi:hypothetical protein
MKKTLPLWFATAALLLCMPLAARLSAQQTTPTPDQPSAAPAQQAAPAPQQAPTQPDQAAPNPNETSPAPDSASPSQDQVFTGTISKIGGKYVLQDASGKSYDLDHQELAQKYEGKQVRVKGTLDPDGKTIHVR